VNSDRAVVEVFELTRELDIGGMVRIEMIAEPDRAVAVLRHAMRAKVRNRAALGVANWKSGFDPRDPDWLVDGDDDDGPPGPPNLATLEHAWSNLIDDEGKESRAFAALLAMMGAVVGVHGGFRPLLEKAYGTTQAHHGSNVNDPGAPT
jgi:hypothetical protein